MRRLRTDRQAATALEFALTFPVVLLFIFGLLAAFSLIVSRRAIDYGIEKALRYGVVHSAAGTAGVTTAFTNAATAIWGDVGAHATLSITPSTLAVGQVLKVSVTYTWGPPAPAPDGPINSTIFTGFTMTGSASMPIVN